MKFLLVLITIVSGSEMMPGNSATVNLGEDAFDGKEDARLEQSVYEFSYTGAFVAQGSYSGLKMGFRTKEQDDDYHELTLFIPAHDEFEIWYESSKGEYILNTPGVPFTFKADQIPEIEDRRGRPRPMKIEMSYRKKVGKNHWAHKSMVFANCNIHVESLFIKEGELTFSGDFECGSGTLESNTRGTFSVTDGELGVSKVD